MDKNKNFTMLVNLVLLILILFFKWQGDMTFRFSTILVLNSLHGQFYSDMKLRRINTIVSLVLIVIVFVLGFFYDYYKF